MLNDKTILITGGTGSFGKKCTEIILKKYKPEKLIIFSRDELKQFEMSQIFSEETYSCIRYFIGDVRDKDRLYRAFDGVDYVIHAAALKQVPAAERNPFEVIKTNIIGAENIINAAIDRNVKKVVALSTDKAANPINLYGATKLCSDKLFISGNSYSGVHKTRFSVVRYGNVVGSRGSVIPFFLRMKERGVFPITDSRMTRFWITLDQGVDFVLKCLDMSDGGELFVPKIPSMNIMDLAKAISQDTRCEMTGIRPGEKIHEVMITKDDARNALEFDDYYIVEPEFNWWSNDSHLSNGAKKVDKDFEYNSETNSWFLSIDEMKEIIKNICLE
ncbi:MAG: UDP-N-acetylglucosamine 4,6-dehydratase (inverting) [Candidatus Brocadiaceae bacterium]|nr:UDP-N-acetylglucosamine 4,6-dehydratase (inverting) [Candidatus Brocadiaceae bacterium]